MKPSILIIGSQSEIAKAFIKNSSNRSIQIFGVCRHSFDQTLNTQNYKEFQISNYTDLMQIQKIMEQIQTLDHYITEVIHFVGALNYPREKGPEKKIEDFHLKDAIKHYEINALVFPTWMSLLMKHWKQKEIRHIILNSQEHIKIIALSAMLSSISENNVGGWYSYRATKAALNMFVKTFSIELNRYFPDQVSCVSYHPGTTDTPMTRNYLQSVKHKIHTPQESAKNLDDLLQNLHSEHNGSLINWDKRIIGF